jgi:hypothetical protein
MRTIIKSIGAGLALGAAFVAPAAAQELITNGGFEAGRLVGWTEADGAGGSGGFFVRPDGTQFDPFRPAVGPATGSFYAVSDGTGAGSHALIQTFTVAGPAASVVLSFDMFVDSYAAAATPLGLDYIGAPNQQARVDLLSAGASAFDTGANVLKIFYQGTDPAADPLQDNPHPYTHYLFDITSLAGDGGTFQLRFAEADNQDTLYLGVDNVSIRETPAVPEASTLVSFCLTACGMAALMLRARRGRGQPFPLNT